MILSCVLGAWNQMLSSLHFFAGSTIPPVYCFSEALRLVPGLGSGTHEPPLHGACSLMAKWKGATRRAQASSRPDPWSQESISGLGSIFSQHASPHLPFWKLTEKVDVHRHKWLILVWSTEPWEQGGPWTLNQEEHGVCSQRDPGWRRFQPCPPLAPWRSLALTPWRSLALTPSLQGDSASCLGWFEHYMN